MKDNAKKWPVGFHLGTSGGPCAITQLLPTVVCVTRHLEGSDSSLSTPLNHAIVEINKSGKRASATTKTHKKLSTADIIIHLAQRSQVAADHCFPEREQGKKTFIN